MNNWATTKTVLILISHYVCTNCYAINNVNDIIGKSWMAGRTQLTCTWFKDCKRCMVDCSSPRNHGNLFFWNDGRRVFNQNFVWGRIMMEMRRGFCADQFLFPHLWFSCVCVCLLDQSKVYQIVFGKRFGNFKIQVQVTLKSPKSTKHCFLQPSDRASAAPEY